MSCGRLWIIRGTSSGSGYHLVLTLVRLWVFILATVMKRRLVNCGNLLPPVYRQCAIAYTDFWAAYGAVLPSKCHRAVGKQTGKTSYIERFNNTLRQRGSRLVRKTLSFSKSVENHIGAIWHFIHHYNASLLILSTTKNLVYNLSLKGDKGVKSLVYKGKSLKSPLKKA